MSSETVGVDINKEEILYLNEKLKINNILYADIISDEIPEISNKKWNYMILGEIVEHVDNPIYFLSKIKKKYQDVVEQIIITVPNILAKNRIKFMINNSAKLINTDHRFWFTPYTFTKVMYQAGFRNIYLDFADRVTLNKSELIIKKIKKLVNKPDYYPFYYFNSVIGIAKFK